MDIEFKTSKKPVNYKKALCFLRKRVEKVKKGGRELVWFLEHPTTYTAGIRYKEGEILDKSIKIVKTNRGGKGFKKAIVTLKKGQNIDLSTGV